MTDKTWGKLVDKLNTFPLGVFESTELKKMLQILFSEEEADIALNLNSYPESINDISPRFPVTKKSLTKILNTMANKGLVFSKTKKGDRFYALYPFFPGMIELNFMKGHKTNREIKLSELYNEYYQKGGGKQIFSSSTPYTRVIPVNRKIPDHRAVLPYERVAEIIKEHTYYAIATCYCRHQAELLGTSCGKPKNTCLNFGPFARYLVEQGFGKKATADDIHRALDRSEEAGLVHICDNIKSRINFICNCCGCCCVYLKGISQLNLKENIISNRYQATIETSECDGCGNCIEQCQLKSLCLSDAAVSVRQDRCIGCGLCVKTCHSGAISMVFKNVYNEPSENLRELHDSILKDRGMREKSSDGSLY